MSRVRRNVIRITLIVFLSGIILFAYPFVRGIVLDFRLSDGVNSFIDSVKEIPFQPDKENAQPDEEDIPHDDDLKGEQHRRQLAAQSQPRGQRERQQNKAVQPQLEPAKAQADHSLKRAAGSTAVPHHI